MGARVAGDEDAVGVLLALAVEASAAALAAGTTIATSAPISATDTSVAVDTASGFGTYWCIISDGVKAEVVHCDSHSGSTFNNPFTSFQNDYPSGATITRIGRVSADLVGGVRARSGLLTADGATAHIPSVTAAIGDLVEIRARAVSSLGELGPEQVISRRRGDTEFIAPKVQATAIRSGINVSVELEITDPTLAISANPKYKRRDADDQDFDASYQTSWDTSTGTAGTDKSLTRKVTLGGDYTAIECHYSLVHQDCWEVHRCHAH